MEADNRQFDGKLFLKDENDTKKMEVASASIDVSSLGGSSFDSQLRQLNNELIEMGALCEEAITLSAKALAEGSAKIAGGVAPIDNEIDKMERDIETLCLKLLLRQQP